MNIMDIFKTSPVETPVQQSTTTQPATTATAAQPNIPDPTTVATKNNELQQQQQEENKSPLDNFTTLWETPKNEDGSAITPDQPIPQLTAEQITKVIGDTNLAGNAVTPELAAAITEGGESAVTALNTIVQATANNTFTQAILAATRINERNVTAAIEKEREAIPALLREQSATNHAVDENPIFNHPSIKPVVDATRAALLVKNPEATPAEITKMTQDFILTMGQQFAPKEEVDPNAPVEQDWGKFLDSTG